MITNMKGKKATMKETIEQALCKKVLILVNHSVVIYNFRKELVQALVEHGYEVFISCPQGSHTEDLKKMGAKVLVTDFKRHSTNPVDELKLLKRYVKIMNDIRPEIVLTYTIKPNVYGGIAAMLKRIPYIANITGLGISIENGGTIEKIALGMYKFGLRKAKMVFFQNTDNQSYFIKNGIISGKYDLLPGSGVNLKEFPYVEYPDDSGNIIFLVIGRLMKDKGTDEILEAAENIKKEFPRVVIRLLGFYDGDYEDKINMAVEKGYVEYLGQRDSIQEYLQKSHATIHASYHEGMSNVLLETAATGRPIIATDIPGCREICVNGVTGITFKPKDSQALTRAVRNFMNLSYQQKRDMGIAGRKKAEKEFDRTIVIQRYLQEILNENSNPPTMLGRIE